MSATHQIILENKVGHGPELESGKDTKVTRHLCGAGPAGKRRFSTGDGHRHPQELTHRRLETDTRRCLGHRSLEGMNWGRDSSTGTGTWMG